MKRPDRLGLEELDAEGEGEAEDGMGGAQMIWRDVKVREYGSGSEGSIGRVKFSTNVNGNGGLGVEGPVAVSEARVWSISGMLERLTLCPTE